MEANNYTTCIVWTAGHFTKLDGIRFSKMRDVHRIDEAAENGEVFIPVCAAIVKVHNEKARGNQDYDVLCIKDSTGAIYTTSSKTFMSDVKEYYEELSEELSAGSIGFQCLRQATRNYKDKYMLMCGLVEGPHVENKVIEPHETSEKEEESEEQEE